MKNRNILVSGSLVYDRIMDFPGYFKEHIMPDKIHILNVSFMVNDLKESYGGTAGNIAYNLSLLGEKPSILACVGKDFDQYAQWLRKNKIDTSQIKKIDNKHTSSCYITTDKADNQITAFNPGAMMVERGVLKNYKKENSIAIISPGNGKDMENYAEHYKKKGIKYIFDPGQQITALSSTTLKKSIDGAEILIGNDYEIGLIVKKTGWNMKSIISKTGFLIVTKGGEGSEIYEKKSKIVIPAVKLKKIVDPTGAGDAYRAGLIKGIIEGLSIIETGRLASIVASFAVEKQGTQEHKFNNKMLKQKYLINYKEELKQL